MSKITFSQMDAAATPPLLSSDLEKTKPLPLFDHWKRRKAQRVNLALYMLQVLYTMTSHAIQRRLCRNCGKSFKPAAVSQFYCKLVCRQASRRVRDREAKAGLARVPRIAGTTGQAANRLRHADGCCEWCGKRKPLRYDFYGLATDDMIQSEPCLCSAGCFVSWWKAQAAEPGPDDVEPGLWRLIVPAAKPGDDDDWPDDEGDWDDSELGADEGEYGC